MSEDVSATREIDGVSFTVQKLLGKRSLLLLNKLAQRAAGLFGASDGDLGRALTGVLDKLSGDDLLHVTKELLETSTVQLDGGQKALWPQFDTFFRGRMLLLFKVLAFALEANYSDFYGALAGSVGARMRAFRSEVSPPTSPPAGSPTA